MDTYGTILKKRIKQMGYTQQGFADQVPIPLSTLKKYMSDRAKYPIDLLERFAELLDCSYDYLMGATVSPRRDIQDIKDATRLSDESIDKIGRVVEKTRSMNEEEKEGAQSMLDCLDIIIKSDIYNNMAAYLLADSVLKPLEKMLKEFMHGLFGDEELPVKLENVYALAVLQELDKCKREIEQNNNETAR